MVTGVARARTTGGGLRRGWPLRLAGARAHLMEQAWGATVAYGGSSCKLGGGRGSGELGVEATTAVAMRG